jgi:hypothetical protein
MAQLQIEGGEDIFRQLEKLANAEDVGRKMIDAALPVLENAMRRSYGGKLPGKLKIVRAKKAKNGGTVGVVTFSGQTGHYYVKGKGRYPLSSGGLAVFMEYGAAAHGNFPATPAGGYIAKAVAAADEEVTRAMQEAFDRETGGAG